MDELLTIVLQVSQEIQESSAPSPREVAAETPTVKPATESVNMAEPPAPKARAHSAFPDGRRVSVVDHQCCGVKSKVCTIL